MPRFRLSFTERRRRQLALRVDRLDRMEGRNAATPIGAAAMGIGLLARAELGGDRSLLGSWTPPGTSAGSTPIDLGVGGSHGSLADLLAFPIEPVQGGGGGGASAQDVPNETPGAKQAAALGSPDAPAFFAAAAESSDTGISAPWKPAQAMGAGGGAAGNSRGGSGNGTQPFVMAALQGRTARPTAPAPPAAPATIPGVLLPGPVAGPTPGPVITRNAAAQSLNGAARQLASSTASGAPASIVENASSAPDTATSGALNSPQSQFSYFPLYTLDYFQGNVLFPGGYQLATLDGNVELLAQAQNTTGVTFSWNTSGLTNATSITQSGNGNFELKFTWDASNATAATDSVTLTATNSSNQQESQTYYFAVPSGSTSTNTGSANWPTTLSPNTVIAGASAWSSDGVSVDANSSALGTTISLPGYNPNVAALILTYNSVAANPEPIIVAENPLSGSTAVPSAVAATLTFNGTAGTTYYYNTSQLTPGDVQQVALQANASSLGTGRYSYSVQLVDEYSTPTTTTYTGTATVLNESTSAFGAGWTLAGLEQIIPASGGVILTNGGTSLWFSGSFGSGGGTFTDPAGEFSTLTLNSNGTFTRTLTDGTQITFNSAGYQTATINLSGQSTTYTYNGSNQLQSIEDPYGNLTTIAYNNGKLSTIEDPAGRLTTFTFSGNDLESVEQANDSFTTYTYNSSSQVTQISDPLGRLVSVAYDSANRVGTITLPEQASEESSAFQEQGWTNSGTAANPAPATLLAASAASFTDPNGNLNLVRPDWYGLGQPGQTTDALGNVTTNDLNSNGLATVTIDRLNRITQNQYDTHGNLTEQINPDGTTEQTTYNSFAEPLTSTDENGDTTTNTYDIHGNNTVTEDPMGLLTTMTYTSTGLLQTSTNADNQTTTYQYDSQGRLTTTTFPDSSTNLQSFNSQGNVTETIDGNGIPTTYSFNAMNLETGSTNAQSGQTTLTYNADDELIGVTNPQSQTTSYAYDSMNRLTTTTAPLGATTINGYDADGNLLTVTNPTGQVTSYVFNKDNQQTEAIEPITNGTTTSTFDAEGQLLTTANSLGTTTYTYSVRGWEATVTVPGNYVTTNVYSATGELTSQAAPVPGGAGGGPQNPGGIHPDNSGSGGGGGGPTSQLSTYTYNADGLVTSFENALDEITTYSYDNIGDTTAVEAPNGSITSYAFNSMDRLTTVTNALGATTVYGYDSDGNQTSVTDGAGHTTTVLYNSLDLATTMINAKGGVTTITYNSSGQETSLTDPDGNKTQWAYDSDGRLTTLTEPNGSAVTYVYNGNNQVVDTTDEDGRRTTYSYNSLGDMTGESWLNSSGTATYIATFTYNAENQLTSAIDPYATLAFTYNSDGELQTDATSGPGTGQPAVTLTYAYDGDGDETSVQDSLSSSGVTNYSYNIGQQLTTITTSYGGTAGPEVVLGYDTAGRLVSQSRTASGDGQLNTTISYDAADRETTITDGFVSTGGTNTALATYTYGYNAANQVTSETDAQGTYTYTYDNANELTGVTENGTPVGTYSYDLNGNQNGTGFTTTTGNELTASPGYTYTYDKAGNMISQTNTSTDVTTTYTYDYENRLTEATTGGKVVATYTYNALSQRIGIDDNGTQTWTVFNGIGSGATPYADFNGSGSLTERYLFGPTAVNGALTTGILARTSSSGSIAWYLTDQLGSVDQLVSTSGTAATVLDQIVYDSFGNIVSESNPSNGDRFKFAEMEYDSVTGQYYDRARYYDEAIGRFMAQDPLSFAGGTDNLYGYVGNNPTNYTDPSGLHPPPRLITKWADDSGNYTATMGAWGYVASYTYQLEAENNTWESAHSALTAIKKFKTFVDDAFTAYTGTDVYKFITDALEGADPLGDVVMEFLTDETVVTALESGVDGVINNWEEGKAVTAAAAATLMFNDYVQLKKWIAQFNTDAGITNAPLNLSIHLIRKWLHFTPAGYY
jgi:RHS repeat-associated protein